jgi:hypothetical protein
VLEDKFLTDSIKDVRHKVGEIADRLQEKVIKFRDIKSDFGKKNSFDKIKTKDFKTLFYKNIHRAQESIRALEEFSKILGEKIYGNFKMLRFKAYSIEKKAIEKLQAICSN